MSEEKKPETSFVTKVVIVVISVIVIVSFLTPNTDALKRFDTPINQIYLLSFVSNPEGLYMASEILENEKKYDMAIREMRMAIGLLEKHNANPIVIKRYQDRLNLLKSKQ